MGSITVFGVIFFLFKESNGIWFHMSWTMRANTSIVLGNGWSNGTLKRQNLSTYFRCFVLGANRGHAKTMREKTMTTPWLMPFEYCPSVNECMVAAKQRNWAFCRQVNILLNWKFVFSCPIWNSIGIQLDRNWPQNTDLLATKSPVAGACIINRGKY